MGCYQSKDECIKGQTIRQSQTSYDQFLGSNHYQHRFESLMGNEYAQNVKIGPFLDQNTSSNHILESWNKIIWLIDQNILEIGKEIKQGNNCESSILKVFDSVNYKIIPEYQKSIDIQSEQNQTLKQKDSFQVISGKNEETSSLLRQEINSNSDIQVSDTILNRWDQVYLFKNKYSFIQNYLDVQILCYSIVQDCDFRQAIIKGPPKYFRWACWKISLLRNEKIIANIQYEQLLNQECNVDSCIKKELNRTLVNHPFLQHEQHKNIGQNQLSRVLRAIAIYLPEVSYCQGMNSIACFLLINSSADETNTFKGFLSLLLDPKHSLQYCFIEGLPLFCFLAFVIREKLKEEFPEVNQLLANFSDSLWLQKYIMTIFLDTMDLGTSLRIWDYVIVRGFIQAIPELTVAMLYQLKNKIKTSDQEELYQILGSNQNDFINIETVIDYIQNGHKISSHQIRDYASKFFKQQNTIKNNYSQDFKNLIINYDQNKFD